MIKKRVLIIGSNGMLGQSVLKQFENELEYELMLASFEEDSFIPNHSYEQIDISDKKAVKKLILNFFPDFVINLAAYTNVDKSEIEKELCWNINVNATEYLAKYCVPSNAHLIQISSDYVFDGENGPYSEVDLPNPISYYGRSKLAGENVIKRFDIASTVLRTNVLFGNTKYGRPDFVKWVVNTLKENKSIKIVTDQINNPTYLDDLAGAIKDICITNKSGLYNIGGAEILDRYSFTNRICDFFDLDFSMVTPISTEDLQQLAKRPLKSGLINLKAETEINYKPTPLEECFRIMKNEWGTY